MDILSILALLGLIAFVGFFYYIEQTRSEHSQQHFDPYNERDYRYWKSSRISEVFTTQTLAGFKIQYRLELLCERVNNEEFNRARMLDDYSKICLAYDYNNEVFQAFFDNWSCFFFFELGVVTKRGEDYQTIVTPLGRILPEHDGLVLNRVLNTQITYGLGDLTPFRSKGCEVKILHFQREVFNVELVEENYAMLTNEQKLAILASDRYGDFEEALAVAALKRRFDLLDNNEQTHETDDMVIETVKAGRGVKIKWQLKRNYASQHILGFRRTGGFFSDPWDENNNGAMVVHNYQNGEVVELLNENEANFYTFFLRAPAQEQGQVWKSNPVRFQLTVASQEETEAIEAILERFEQRDVTVDDPRENMSQVINELGLVIEFHDAMDAMEESLIAKIKKKKLPKKEQEEKIEFVRDTVRLQREKYQP